MPTYAQVDVHAAVISDGGQTYRGDRAVKAGTGIWTVFVRSSDSKLCAALSVDNGLTWAAEEVVWTPTTPSNEASWNYVITKDRINNVPVIAAVVQDTAGIRVRIFRRESGVWTAKANFSSTTLTALERMFLFQHPTTGSAWFIIWSEQTTNNRHSYARSTDDLSTWTSSASLAGSINNNGFNGGKQWWIMRSDGALFGLYLYNDVADRIADSAVTNNWDSTTPTITNTNRDSELGGPWGDGQGPKGIHLAENASGEIRVSWWIYNGGVSDHQLHTRLRSSGGTWGSNDASGYIIGTVRDSRTVYLQDASWRIYTNANNTGSFTNPNVKYHHKPSGSWVTVEMIDEAKDHHAISSLSPSGGVQNAGDILFYFNDTDDDWTVVLSDDLNVGSFSKTITQTINFSQVLSNQAWIKYTISPGAVTPVSGGGRQIIRGANNRLWHCYYDGEVRVAYSDNEGRTWTIVGVGVTWQPAGMCLSQGSSNNPVLVLTRPSNDDFYIYQWNGSSFVLKKQLNEPSNASEAFQVLYTGSVYMLIYGFVTASGDRRVYSRTSSDLVTWNAAVTVKNGGSSGTGPHKYRRVAACLDAAGDIHAVYSIRVSGDHTLFYRKYVAGTWGTEETVVIGGDGNNLADYQSGLSIAVDDAGNVHVAARVRNTGYTSRVKVRYYQRSSGVWTAEDVHIQVDADQGFPSLSLNGRIPSVIWDSAGLGLGTVRAKRASDGSSWSYSTIYTTAKTNAQSIHGPSYGSSYNYVRGQVGSVTGSEEYFQSNDALSGTAAYMENTLNFSGILSTLRRVMSNTVTFTQSLLGVRSLGLTNTITFTQRLNFARERAMASTLEFRQNLFGSKADEVVYQTITFTDDLQGIKDPTLTITQTITFTHSLTFTRPRSMTNSVAFSGILAANRHRLEGITQTITFTHSLPMKFSLNKLLTNTLNFLQGLVGMKADEGCEPAFTPERTIASEDAVLFVYFIGPLPTLDLSVQLKRPEFGNTRRQSLQVKVNRTRGGKLRPHAKSPTYEPQTMTFADLSYLKLEQVRNFLRVTKGKKVYFIDERSRKWVGYITTSDIDLADEAHSRGGTFTADFEGSLV